MIRLADSSHGNDTNHTDKFAAGLLLASLISMRASPDRWSGAVSFGVVKSSRWLILPFERAVHH